jgi:hypothetical protein
MSRFSPEEKDEILRTQRELLEDAERAGEDAFQADSSSELRSPAWVDELLGPTDPLEKWRRGQLEAEAERAAYRQREADDTNARRSRDWDRYVRGHIERALAEHDKLWIESIGQVVGEERKYMHAYIDHVAKQLRGEFAQALAAYASKGDATVAELRKEMARTKAVDKGSLIDITPEVVRKTRNDAA